MGHDDGARPLSAVRGLTGLGVDARHASLLSDRATCHICGEPLLEGEFFNWAMGQVMFHVEQSGLARVGGDDQVCQWHGDCYERHVRNKGVH